ncbi:unnamed protein product [Paramecium octaurelia]|uniref:Uncharacterized protein n=1 Tax=Paramecium octaurelia TaxID=43137 RepID=A0A8S1TSK8_PAROT|nr:unnamed protein product [Paramecium octaurelia]
MSGSRCKYDETAQVINESLLLPIPLNWQSHQNTNPILILPTVSACLTIQQFRTQDRHH